MLPAELPNADATRVIFSPKGPGAIKLTAIAAVIRAIKALTLKTMMSPRTVAIPTANETNGQTVPTGEPAGVAFGDGGEAAGIAGAGADEGVVVDDEPFSSSGLLSAAGSAEFSAAVAFSWLAFS